MARLPCRNYAAVLNQFVWLTAGRADQETMPAVLSYCELLVLYTMEDLTFPFGTQSTGISVKIVSVQGTLSSLSTALCGTKHLCSGAIRFTLLKHQNIKEEKRNLKDHM